MTQRRISDNLALATDIVVGGTDADYAGVGSTHPDHSGSPMSPTATMTQYEQKQQATRAVQTALDRRDGGGSS